MELTPSGSDNILLHLMDCMLPIQIKNIYSFFVLEFAVVSNNDQNTSKDLIGEICKVCSTTCRNSRIVVWDEKLQLICPFANDNEIGNENKFFRIQLTGRSEKNSSQNQILCCNYYDYFQFRRKYSNSNNKQIDEIFIFNSKSHENAHENKNIENIEKVEIMNRNEFVVRARIGILVLLSSLSKEKILHISESFFNNSSLTCSRNISNHDDEHSKQQIVIPKELTKSNYSIIVNGLKSLFAKIKQLRNRSNAHENSATLSNYIPAISLVKFLEIYSSELSHDLLEFIQYLQTSKRIRKFSTCNVNDIHVDVDVNDLHEGELEYKFNFHNQVFMYLIKDLKYKNSSSSSFSSSSNNNKVIDNSNEMVVQVEFSEGSVMKFIEEVFHNSVDNNKLVKVMIQPVALSDRIVEIQKVVDSMNSDAVSCMKIAARGFINSTVVKQRKEGEKGFSLDFKVQHIEELIRKSHCSINGRNYDLQVLKELKLCRRELAHEKKSMIISALSAGGIEVEVEKKVEILQRLENRIASVIFRLEEQDCNRDVSICEDNTLALCMKAKAEDSVLKPMISSVGRGVVEGFVDEICCEVSKSMPHRSATLVRKALLTVLLPAPVVGLLPVPVPSGKEKKVIITSKSGPGSVSGSGASTLLPGTPKPNQCMSLCQHFSSIISTDWLQETLNIYSKRQMSCIHKFRKNKELFASENSKYSSQLLVASSTGNSIVKGILDDMCDSVAEENIKFIFPQNLNLCLRNVYCKYNKSTETTKEKDKIKIIAYLREYEMIKLYSLLSTKYNKEMHLEILKAYSSGHDVLTILCSAYVLKKCMNKPKREIDEITTTAYDFLNWYQSIFESSKKAELLVSPYFESYPEDTTGLEYLIKELQSLCEQPTTTSKDSIVDIDKKEQTISEFLDRNLVIESTIFDDGETILHQAVQANNRDLVKLLLNRGIVDVKKTNKDCKTALTYCCEDSLRSHFPGQRIRVLKKSVKQDANKLLE